jgi:hypothetical protein
MLCADLLQLYSEYRDGVCDPALEQEVRSHLADCRKCMDYDAYISRGVMLLKATSDIAPSARFARQLERRLGTDLRSARPHAPAGGVRAGVMAALVTAAAVTLLAAVASTSRIRHPAPGGAVLAVTSTLVAATVPAAVDPTVVRPHPAAQATRQPPGPPFVAAIYDAGTVDLTDQSVPAFARDVAAPQPQVSFTTWVTLGH